MLEKLGQKAEDYNDTSCKSKEIIRLLIEPKINPDPARNGLELGDPAKISTLFVRVKNSVMGKLHLVHTIIHKSNIPTQTYQDCKWFEQVEKKKWPIVFLAKAWITEIDLLPQISTESHASHGGQGQLSLSNVMWPVYYTDDITSKKRLWYVPSGGRIVRSNVDGCPSFIKAAQYMLPSLCGWSSISFDKINDNWISMFMNNLIIQLDKKKEARYTLYSVLNCDYGPGPAQSYLKVEAVSKLKDTSIPTNKVYFLVSPNQCDSYVGPTFSDTQMCTEEVYYKSLLYR